MNEKEDLQSLFEKGRERDLFQVFANSFGIVLFALLQLIFVGVQAKINILIIIGAAISVGSNTADTWATEIGTLSKSDPRLIYNPLKTVNRGDSGGITLLGLVAALLGGALIGCFVIFYLWLQIKYQIVDNVSYDELLLILGYVSFFSFLGQLIDSLLGATIQEIYLCLNCMKTIEISFHSSCAVETEKIRGLSHINNDVVNLVSSISASLIGMACISLI